VATGPLKKLKIFFKGVVAKGSETFLWHLKAARNIRDARARRSPLSAKAKMKKQEGGVKGKLQPPPGPV